MSAKGASSLSVKPDQILLIEPSGELKFKGLYYRQYHDVDDHASFIQ